MTIRYEHIDDSLQTDLADTLYQYLGVKPVLEVLAPGQLERFSGKAKRVLDHRDA